MEAIKSKLRELRNWSQGLTQDEFGQLFIKLKTNFVRYSLIASVTAYVFFATLGRWIFSDPSLMLNATLITAVGSIIFILFDIQNAVNPVFRGASRARMTDAFPDIKSAVLSASKESNSSPAIINILGMRLRTIRQLLEIIADSAKAGQLGPRKINITVYHVNFSFLISLDRQKMQDRSKVDTSVPATNFKSQATQLEATVSEIEEMFANAHNLQVEIRNYRAIPTWWAINVDDTKLFWGWFTYDSSGDWLGPQNRCFIGDKTQMARNQVFSGFKDRLAAMVHLSRLTTNEDVLAMRAAADQAVAYVELSAAAPYLETHYSRMAGTFDTLPWYTDESLFTKETWDNK